MHPPARDDGAAGREDPADLVAPRKVRKGTGRRHDRLGRGGQPRVDEFARTDGPDDGTRLPGRDIRVEDDDVGELAIERCPLDGVTHPGTELVARLELSNPAESAQARDLERPGHTDQKRIIRHVPENGGAPGADGLAISGCQRARVVEDQVPLFRPAGRHRRQADVLIRNELPILEKKRARGLAGVALCCLWAGRTCRPVRAGITA